MSEPHDPSLPDVPSTHPAGSQGWGELYGEPLGYGASGAQPAAPQQPWGPQDMPHQSGQPQYGQPQYGQPQYGQPQYGQPQYGQPQYGQPQYGQPQYGQPQYGQPQYGQPGGYVLPMQRGIVPLRPLGLGEIYDGAFRAIRANPRVMFGISAIVVTIMVLIQTVIQWSSLGFLSELSTASGAGEVDSEAIMSGLTDFLQGSAISSVISMIAATALTGLLIVSVSQSVIGRQLSVGEAWQRVRRQLWRLLLLTLLVTFLLVAAPVAYLLVLIVWATSTSDLGSIGPLVAVMLPLVLVVVVVVFWVSVRTMLATPALMLEERGVLTGLKRGWQLSRGSFWRLLGITLLTSMIASTVASFIVYPASLISSVVAGPEVLSDPRALAINAIASILASLLTTPFSAGVTALLYIDTRIRREGLDIELTRAAELAAQQSSRQDT